MNCRIPFSLVILMPLPFLGSCGKRASAAYPNMLHFAYGVSAEMTEDSLRRIDLLRSYLGRTLGMQVEIERVVAYAPTIEAMCASRADVATMGPFAYNEEPVSRRE